MKLITSFFVIFLTFIIKSYSQDFALKQLEKSPRHHEWIELKSDSQKLHCFVVYPEKSENSQAVIIIHENRGLTDWVRSFADQIAAKGYIAIAPDLLSECQVGISKTSDFNSSDDAKKALYQLDPNKITMNLNDVYKYVSNLPSSSGKVATMGFCWGGSQTFRFTTNNSDIKAGLVFYGRAPKKQETINKITAPVYGFYGGEDQRINATLPETEKMMKTADKRYNYKIYEGAGHAFMRRGDNPSGSKENKKARKNAWKRIIKILDSL